jgi:hypothetical protein
MELFETSVLDTYRNDPRIVSALKDVNLLNLSEFKNWFAPPDKKSSRLEEVARAQGKGQEYTLRRQASALEKETIAGSVLEELALNVCLDKKGDPAIGQTYGINAVRRAVANAKFDLLVAIEPTPIPARTTLTASQHKLDRIVGFIIAEYGECKRKPTVWSINLICNRPNKNGFSIKCNTLLGCFVYCIKNSTYTQEGVLELAGGYSNMPGFICYTKMGFNKDLSLFGRDCFRDFNNLPMICNLSQFTNETIINCAADRGRRVVTPVEDDSGLYSAGKINQALQDKLILCNDLLYRVQLAFFDISQDPFSLGSRELHNEYNRITTLVGVDRNKIITELQNDRRDILRTIASTAPAAVPAAATAPSKDDGSCLQQCFRGICECIGWKGGRKTRKLHKKHGNKKSHHKKHGNKKSHGTRRRKNTHRK